MKRKTLIQLQTVMLMTLLLVSLTGCGKKAQMPEQYELGEEETITAFVPEGEKISFTQEETEEGEAAVYDYSGLSDTGTLIESYAAQMEGEEDPFSVVDGDMVLTDEPDYTQTEGSVNLAKAAPEDGKVYFLTVDWTEEACTVTVDTREGAISTGEEEEEPAEEQAQEGLTLVTAVDYLRSLTPDELGLDGSSMDEYEIYALDGAVYVDGRPCLRLKVCSTDNLQQANEISGNFLITGDKTHVYSLDEANGIVKELHV
jgi:hypothetical protein